MKKKAILRGLLGLPLGVFMGYVITICISLFYANGQYSAVVPSLIEKFGSELGAVIFQAVMCGILGSSFAAASTIWETDKWSIAKQTGIYFFVTSITMLPIAYVSDWMEHSFTGFLLYFSMFVAIFLIMWVIQYLIWKNKIKRINNKMAEK